MPGINLIVILVQVDDVDGKDVWAFSVVHLGWWETFACEPRSTTFRCVKGQVYLVDIDISIAS